MEKIVCIVPIFIIYLWLCMSFVKKSKKKAANVCPYMYFIYLFTSLVEARLRVKPNNSF